MSTLEQLVREIVEELTTSPPTCRFQKPKKHRLITVSFPDFPLELLEVYDIVAEDKELKNIGDLTNEDLVVIGNISLSDLSKLALGIADNQVTSLGMKALLARATLFILHPELGGNTHYQRLFVSYERTLKDFGVCFLNKGEVACRLSMSQKKGPEVMTEADVKKVSGSFLYLEEGTILTYSAKEWLNQNGITILYNNNKGV